MGGQWLVLLNGGNMEWRVQQVRPGSGPQAEPSALAQVPRAPLRQRGALGEWGAVTALLSNIAVCCCWDEAGVPPYSG